MKQRTLFTLGVLVVLCGAASRDISTVSRVTASGWLVYVPVRRSWVQRLLDDFKGPSLYLPAATEFADQPPDTNPLLIDIAKVSLKHLKPGSGDNSAETTEVTISIPFLTQSPQGPNDSTLGLFVLYEADRSSAYRVDFTYRYIPVSRISLDEKGLLVERGNSEMRIDFGTVEAASCEGHDAESEPSSLIFSLYGTPDFDFCSFYDYNENFNCYYWARMDAAVASSYACIAWNVRRERACVTTATVITVSDSFQNIIPVDDGTPVLAADQYDGEYNIEFKLPCVI